MYRIEYFGAKTSVTSEKRLTLRLRDRQLLPEQSDAACVLLDDVLAELSLLQ